MITDLDSEEGLSILKKNYIGYLAYIFEDRPFVVPVTYYYDPAENCVIGYSNSGHKIDAMRINNSVSLLVDEIDAVNQWQSVQIQGEYEELHSSDAKFLLHRFSQGIKDLVAEKENMQLQFISEFSSLAFSDDIPVIYKINIHNIKAKSRAQ
jgi:nitroimidazol reductase NimA-like FMN-containing flavoprotein (pyridoxamine 5'-phosphate oxidase superfamily)